MAVGPERRRAAPGTEARSAAPLAAPRRAPARARGGRLLAASRLAAVLGLLGTVALTACCPVTGAQPTAFTASLSPLHGSEALARLADGRQLTLTGVTDVPEGPVYVTGRLLADGRVAVTSVRRLAEPGPPAD